MRAQTALVALVFAVQTLAQDPDFDIINQPSNEENVPAGETYTIEWALGSSALTGPVTITLLGGADSNTLESLGVIGHVSNEDLKFDWAVDSSLGTDNLYGISIALDDDTTHFQYSPGFHIVAVADSSTSTTSSAASSSAASSTPASSTSASSTSVSTTVVSSSIASSTTASSTATTSSSVISSAPATTNSTTSQVSSTTSAVTSSTTSDSNSTTLVSTASTITTKASSTASKTATSSAASATSTLVTSGSDGRHLSSAVSGAVLASFVGSVALHLLGL